MRGSTLRIQHWKSGPSSLKGLVRCTAVYTPQNTPSCCVNPHNTPTCCVNPHNTPSYCVNPHNTPSCCVNLHNTPSCSVFLPYSLLFISVSSFIDVLMKGNTLSSFCHASLSSPGAFKSSYCIRPITDLLKKKKECVSFTTVHIFMHDGEQHTVPRTQSTDQEQQPVQSASGPAPTHTFRV